MLNMGFEKQWSITILTGPNKVVFLASNIANSIPHNEEFKNQDVCQRDQSIQNQKNKAKIG